MLLALAGCVDELRGSNVQFDFSPSMPVQASAFRAPGAMELPNNVHFTLYAFSETDDGGNVIGRLFELQRFEVHHIVDLDSPCFIDVGEHVPFPGLHVSQFAAHMKETTGIDDVANPPPGASERDQIEVATAIQRQANVALLAGDDGPKVITSWTTYAYPAVGADCNDASGIPPATCTDDASNERRLAMCAAAWDDTQNDHLYYEGTDLVLTAPLDGITYGFVDGMNPINLAPVGGAQFFVDEQLTGFAGFAVYWQRDDAPPGDLGTQLLFGRPTEPTRGVIHVHMTSLVSSVTAELAIFANLDEDDVHF